MLLMLRLGLLRHYAQPQVDVRVLDRELYYVVR